MLLFFVCDHIFSTYFAYHFNCTTNLSLNQHSTTVVAARLFYFSLVICSICWISTSVGHFAVSVYAILHVLFVHNVYCSWKMPLVNSVSYSKCSCSINRARNMHLFFSLSWCAVFYNILGAKNIAKRCNLTFEQLLQQFLSFVMHNLVLRIIRLNCIAKSKREEHNKWYSHRRAHSQNDLEHYEKGNSTQKLFFQLSLFSFSFSLSPSPK